MKKLEKNQKVQVRADHPFHPNRVGYFDFLGGPKMDCVVIREEKDPNALRRTFFAVGVDDLVE